MEQVGEEIQSSANDLLVLLDETGHESFAGNQPYYGFGGCITLGGAAYETLKTMWRDVRLSINENADAPLHASDITKLGNAAAFAALAKFFLARTFLRAAVISTRETPLPSGMHPAVPVMGALREDIALFARLLPCKRVIIVAESSQRGDPILRERFHELRPEGATLPIPVEYWRMSKKAGEPGLEVADFIISAAGSQVRHYMKRKPGFAPDFRDVFCRLPSEGCQCSLITKVYHAPVTGSIGVERIRFDGKEFPHTRVAQRAGSIE